MLHCIFPAIKVLLHCGLSTETILQMKSRKKSFAHNLFFRCLIIMQFCIEHSIGAKWKLLAKTNTDKGSLARHYGAMN